MAFDCPHCGHRTNELQQANAIAIGGAIYTCKISTKADLNRQLVKTDTAVVKIPEIDFEIPAQRGHLTTIEGLLSTVVDDLSGDQPLRKVSIISLLFFLVPRKLSLEAQLEKNMGRSQSDRHPTLMRRCNRSPATHTNIFYFLLDSIALGRGIVPPD